MKDAPVMLAEIIGPSGAGKSSISILLNARNSHVKAGISIWRLSSPLLARSLVASIPILARISYGDKEFRVEESKQIIRLQALYGYLDRTSRRSVFTQDQSSPIAFYLDEGIVFAISQMRFERPKFSISLERWEEKILSHSARLLDRIIWLDAPDDILINRIRSRNNAHRMKFRTDSEIADFLAGYRDSYEFVVKRLRQYGHVKVERFDTSSKSLDEIAERLLPSNGVPV